MKARGDYGLSQVKSTTNTSSTQSYSESRTLVTTIPFLRICVQCLLLLVSLTLGFRISREAQIVVLYFRQSGHHPSLFRRVLPHYELPFTSALPVHLQQIYGAKTTGLSPSRFFNSSLLGFNTSTLAVDVPGSAVLKSGVSVGRHKILIRPWPHPEAEELMQGYSLLKRVQLEQQRLYGVKVRKPIIVITPTYVRTFQAVYLSAFANVCGQVVTSNASRFNQSAGTSITIPFQLYETTGASDLRRKVNLTFVVLGLAHTLSSIPGPVIWIVVESGNVTTETASLLEHTHVQQLVHIGFKENMPEDLEERALMESSMRVEGLRCVREKNLDGIVLFADDSNIHTLQLFDEVQKVEWVGTFSVGMLGHAKRNTSTRDSTDDDDHMDAVDTEKHTVFPINSTSWTHEYEIQIQGPVCDEVDDLFIGWHACDPSVENIRFLSKISGARKRRLEWAGFALNSQAVWQDSKNRPNWLKSWDDWIKSAGGAALDIRDMVTDETFIKPLGSCGKKVLSWWTRMELPSDIKHPPRWNVEPQLKIVVQAKRTPWLKHPIRSPSPLPSPSVPGINTTNIPLVKEPGIPVVKGDAGVPFGKEAVLPRTGTLKGTGRVKSKQTKRRRNLPRGEVPDKPFETKDFGA